MNELLIDTDTLSYFLKSDPSVRDRAREYLRVHRGFSFSIITRYEITRGLKIRNADNQLVRFNSIRGYSREINLSESIVEQAAEIYAQLYSQGNIISDADILIAATAMVERIPLVTNNQKHFGRIEGLILDNWKS